MRTRAQASRDAALRRLTRVNRSLAAAALVGTGVLTDVVANTASGHTRKVIVERPATTAVSHRAALKHRHADAIAHRRVASKHSSEGTTSTASDSSQSLQSSSAPAPATSSQSSSSSSGASSSSSSSVSSGSTSTSQVVVVSGGS